MSTINININKYEDVMEKYDNNKLSSELAYFIYNQYMSLPLRKGVELNIETNFEITEEQEGIISDMIHRYFGLQVQKSIYNFRYKTKYQIFLFLIGVLLIAISNLKVLAELSTIHEILLIIGWVAVWELFYDGFFVDYKENIKRKRYKKLSEVKINFIK